MSATELPLNMAMLKNQSVGKVLLGNRRLDC